MDQQKPRAAAPKNYTSKALKKLKGQAQKYSDSVQIFTLSKAAAKFKTFLSVTVEPRTFKGKTFPSKGPFVYGLSEKEPKFLPLQGAAWKKIAKYNYDVLPTRSSVKKLIFHAVAQSRRSLKKKIYVSKVVGVAEEKRDKVAKLNFNFMREDLEYSKGLLRQKSELREEKLAKALRALKKKSDSLNAALLGINSRRFVRKLLGNRRLAQKTAEINSLERKIRKLKSVGQKIKNKIRRLREETGGQLKQLERRTRQKSQSLAKGAVYNPQKKDLIVRAKILLVPFEK